MSEWLVCNMSSDKLLLEALKVIIFGNILLCGIITAIYPVGVEA